MKSGAILICPMSNVQCLEVLRLSRPSDFELRICKDPEITFDSAQRSRHWTLDLDSRTRNPELSRARRGLIGRSNPPATRWHRQMEEQMFNNLIESSSHRREYRRRGSFFLFTTASYALFFVIAGIASIYAYDARMEDQNLELATIMPLIDLPITDPPRDTSPSPAAARNNDSPQNFYIRRIPMATVDNTRVPPATISTAPNPDLPMPAHGIVKFGNTNADPIGTGGNDFPKTAQRKWRPTFPRGRDH